MHTININVVKGRSHKKFSTQKFNIQKFPNTKFPDLWYHVCALLYDKSDGMNLIGMPDIRAVMSQGQNITPDPSLAKLRGWGLDTRPAHVLLTRHTIADITCQIECLIVVISHDVETRQ